MILIFKNLDPGIIELEQKLNIMKFSFKDGVVMKRFLGGENGKYLFFKEVKEKFGNGKVKYEKRRDGD